MNHLKQIAAKLPEYGIDAMLLNSEPGEFYAVGFHGEGNVVVTPEACYYFTDSRYIEAAQAQGFTYLEQIRASHMGSNGLDADTAPQAKDVILVDFIRNATAD